MTQLTRTQSIVGSSNIGTLGSLDGLHRGHQTLLQTMRDLAGRSPGARRVVLSFYPHPAVVLGKTEALSHISSLRDTCELLTIWGIDDFVKLRFTSSLSQLSAADFVEQILFRKLNLTTLVVGEDACIGRGREGNVAFLDRAFKKVKKELIVVPPLQAEQVGTISSRKIRQLINEGRILEAAQLLGRPFRMTGRVVRGNQRGRTIGFPTANIQIGHYVTPCFGVYASRVILDGTSYAAVTNIGVKPTFGSHHPSVESFLLDYQGPEFYRKLLRVDFVGHIRAERKFGSKDELVAQIKSDCTRARELLSLL